MKIVLDTNLFLVCISRKSHLHWIFEKLVLSEYTLCISSEILMEYEEVIAFHMGSDLAEYALKTILNLPNIIHVNIYYKWQLLKDADDNKFVDCAVACNAHYLVSHDKHFKRLKSIDFPKIPLINAKEFKRILDLVN